MKKALYIPVALLCLFFLGSCKKFAGLVINPNQATSAPPALLLTGIIEDAYLGDNETPWNGGANYAQMANQFWYLDYTYYGYLDYNFGSSKWYYSSLQNVQQMQLEARKNSGNEGYLALVPFFKAYFFTTMTTRTGDIPLTQALKGTTGTTTPAYDSQKSVYLQVFKWLDSANSALASLPAGTTISGDNFCAGDLVRWRQVVNSFRLRVLISLSHVAADPDLNVIPQFSKIISNPATYPIFTSNAQSAEIIYSADKSDDYYPQNPGNIGTNIGRNVLSATYVDLLKSLADPRLFTNVDPTDSAVRAGDAAGLNLTSYKGANSGAVQGDVLKLVNNGLISNPKKVKYFGSFVGEPYIWIGYPEIMFTIAEAINRGWIPGDASQYYQNGINASLAFYNINAAQVPAYLAQPAVVYAGNNQGGLTQILTQKYLAFFMNSGWEAYYNHRRTGIPAFATGPANNNGGRFPVRWRYPSAEQNGNAANLQTALQRQFGGSDDINGLMFILQGGSN